MVRCHTSFLEGKRPKPIKLNQKQEIHFPSKPLANANVHRLLKLCTCRENDIDETRVCIFDALVIFSKQNIRSDVIDQ